MFYFFFDAIRNYINSFFENNIYYSYPFNNSQLFINNNNDEIYNFIEDCKKEIKNDNQYKSLEIRLIHLNTIEEEENNDDEDNKPDRNNGAIKLKIS